MNDKEEFFQTGNAPSSSRAGKKIPGKGCFRSLILFLLLGCALLVAALIVIEVTDSGERIKKALIARLGGVEEPPSVDPIVVERIVEKEVEKIVEKEVEKIVEVEVLPPMPSSYVPWKKVDTATLWNEIPVKTKVETEEGGTAVVERNRGESYQIEMTLKVTIPKPNQSAEELSAINEHLPAMLKDFEVLVESAEVSPFYHHLYELKTSRIQQQATRIDQLVSRHNLYDCETVLQIRHPETGQKLLLVQSEMDVVTDGSDGDRWPELDDYISMSQFYQPFTSYGWAKRSSNPNPLLERWQTQLKEYEEEFAIAGLSIERNRYLRGRIDKLTAEIEDMKARSYLIAEADPFFVLPLSFLGRRDENEFGPAIGDYGVIVYGDKAYPAIAGDAGPSWKFGEASLFVARELNERASPYNRPVSDLEVTYLIFPGSADERRGPPDLEAWRARCQELIDQIGGFGEGFELHEWEDVIAKKMAEAETADETAAPATETENEDAPDKEEEEDGGPETPSEEATGEESA